MSDPRKVTTAVAVSDIDEACVARALGLPGDVLPAAGCDELRRLANKYYKAGRIFEIEKLQGENLALTEALREFNEMLTERGMKLRELLRDVGERLRLALEQARQ